MSKCRPTRPQAHLEVLDAARQLLCIQLLHHVVADVKKQQASQLLQAFNLQEADVQADTAELYLSLLPYSLMPSQLRAVHK